MPGFVKIMHIITRMDRGGSAQNTMLTCLGLNKTKYRVVLVSGLSRESRMPPQEAAAVEQQMAEARQQGVKTLAVPALVRRIHPLHDIPALFHLWYLIRKEKPDIVHTHTSKAGILGRWAAWLARTPVIIHTPHGHVFYGHYAAIFSRLFLWTERLTAPLTHRVVALTRGEKADYEKLRLFGKHKMVTIHSGVDIHRFRNAEVDASRKKKELGLPPASLVVGSVGWLLPIKGPDILLAAMKDLFGRFPEVVLVFIGQGEMETDLKHTARKLGVEDRVFFTGWRQDIPEIMQILDLLVLPSLNEGMGRVVVEAMAAGKPVVASKVGGLSDLVSHDENGLLIEPANTGELRAAIEALLADERRRRRMGARGRERAEKFNLEAMIHKLETLYDDCIKQFAR